MPISKLGKTLLTTPASIRKEKSMSEAPDPREELDAQMIALREILQKAVMDAIQGSSEAQKIVDDAEKAGFIVRLSTGVSLFREEQVEEIPESLPDITGGEPMQLLTPPRPEKESLLERASRIVTERRWCPHCSTTATPYYLKSHIVKERVAGTGERDVIEGLQVRFNCSLCGYGEVEPIAAAN